MWELGEYLDIGFENTSFTVALGYHETYTFPVQPPPLQSAVFYHGTSFHSLPSILVNGLHESRDPSANTYFGHAVCAMMSRGDK